MFSLDGKLWRGWNGISDEKSMYICEKTSRDIVNLPWSWKCIIQLLLSTVLIKMSDAFIMILHRQPSWTISQCLCKTKTNLKAYYSVIFRVKCYGKEEIVCRVQWGPHSICLHQIVIHYKCFRQWNESDAKILHPSIASAMAWRGWYFVRRLVVEFYQFINVARFRAFSLSRQIHMNRI